MNGAAVISDIAYDIHSVVGSGDGEFFGFELKLCHTSLSELGTNFESNYDGNTAIIVATGAPLTIPNTSDVWYSVPNMTSFTYNGTDNLIIEIRWNGSNGVSYDCYCAHGSVNRNVSSAEYNGTDGNVADYIIRKKITVQ